MMPPRPTPKDSDGPALLGLDFHGVRVEVALNDPALASSLARDFSFFRTAAVAGPPRVSIQGHLARPPWEGLPAWPSVLVQPGFCAYQHRGSTRWVDYHGRALTRWDFNTESGEVWSEDPDLLHEVLYLLVLSRAGELLDRSGLHRVHALALERDGAALLCLLPSGGGKTTLGLGALEIPGVRLLGDDMALVNRRGQVLPFPLRLGFSRPPPGVDPRDLRRMKRREHGDKWLLDLEALGPRLASGPARPGRLVVGHRLLSGPPKLERAPRRAALPHLAREMVVGLGLPQLVEYFLRLEARDLARKAQLVASRAAAAAALVSRSSVYRLQLSRDQAGNMALLRQLLLAGDDGVPA